MSKPHRKDDGLFSGDDLPGWKLRHVRKSGFTLVELGIVLAIMAIVAAVATPTYTQTLSRNRVEGAARRIAADLERTLSAAMDASANRSIVFDSITDSYTIAGVADLDRPSRSVAVYLDATNYSVDLHSVNFGGSETITFGMHGMPQDGGSLVVSDGANSATVIVDTHGNVSIQI